MRPHTRLNPNNRETAGPQRKRTHPLPDARYTALPCLTQTTASSPISRPVQHHIEPRTTWALRKSTTNGAALLVMRRDSSIGFAPPAAPLLSNQSAAYLLQGFAVSGDPLHDFAYRICRNSAGFPSRCSSTSRFRIDRYGLTLPQQPRSMPSAYAAQ